MTALTQSADRKIVGGTMARRLMAASADPFEGSLMSVNSSGYYNELVAGEPFGGVARQRVPAADAPDSAGDMRVELVEGIFTMIMTLASSQDDVAHRRRVYATDDNALTMDPNAATATLIGILIGEEGSKSVILCATNGYQGVLFEGGITGYRALSATGAQTLTTADLGKILTIANTAALTLTLPAAADCAGQALLIKKTTDNAHIVTLDGSGSETIDEATTFVGLDSDQAFVKIVSDGSGWHVVDYYRPVGLEIANDTGNLTATTAHLDRIITCANTAALTITLPAAASCTGRRLTVIKTSSDTGAITLDGSGAETIDGGATVATVDAQYDTMTIVCDGTEWYIESQKLA